MAVASGMRAVGGSRVCWRRLTAGTSGTAPVRAPLGVPAAWKRWPVRAFRVRRRRCAYGEWRHCAASGREGCGAGGQKHAPAAFLMSSDRPPPARPPAIRGGASVLRPHGGGAGPARGPSRRGPAGTAAAPGGLARRARVRYALFPLLRLLTLHCTRKGGVAKGGGAQQRERGVADDPERPSVDPRGLPWTRAAPPAGGIRAVAAGSGPWRRAMGRALPAPGPSGRHLHRRGLGATGTARPGARHRGLSRR